MNMKGTAFCRTVVETSKIIYKWTICGFRNLYENSNISIHSEQFPPIETDDECKWSITISKNGEYFKLEVTKSASCMSVARITVENVYTSASITRESKTVANDDADLVFHNFIKIEDLLNDSKGFLLHGALTVLCEVYIYIDCVNNDQRLSIPDCTFAKDIGAMFMNEVEADVTLIIDKRELKANKVILAASSEVFAKMFKHQMLETKTGEVEIRDFEFPVMLELLRFAYTGQISRNIFEKEEVLTCLMRAAEKYQMKDLKLKCEEHLSSSLTKSNVADFITISKYLGAQVLLKRSLEYISKHTKVPSSPKKPRINKLQTRLQCKLQSEDCTAPVSLKSPGVYSWNAVSNFDSSQFLWTIYYSNTGFLNPDYPFKCSFKLNSDIIHVEWGGEDFIKVGCNLKKSECKCWVVSINGKKMKELTIRSFTHQRTGVARLVFLPVDSSNFKEASKNGHLTLLFEFWDRIKQAPQNTEILRLGFKLYEIPEHRDLKIITRTRETISAHRAIVAARCPALLKRSQDRKKIYLDVKAMSAKIILKYLYTGEVQISDLPGREIEVLKLAHDLELHRLQAIFIQAVYSKLSIENAVQTYLVAGAGQAEQLTGLVVEFVRRCLPEVQDTDAWEELALPQQKSMLQLLVS